MDLVVPIVETSKLDDLLNSSEPDLEEILDQESIISEIKYSNQKLIKYLCQPSILDMLVTYTTRLSEDVCYDVTEPRRDERIHKFPFVACDILSVANDSIALNFLGNTPESVYNNCKPDENQKIPIWKQIQLVVVAISKGEIPILNSAENIKLEQKNGIQMTLSPPIVKFLRFLDAPPPLNLTLAGYFAKVLRSLIYFKPEHTSYLLFNPYLNYMQKLASHMYSDSIQELLSIVIKLEAPYFKKNPDYYYISQRKTLVNKVILNLHERSYLKEQEDLRASILTNSSNLLAGLISCYKTYINGEDIISVLVESNNIRIFLKGLRDLTQVNIMAPLIRQLCEYFINKYAPNKKPSALKLPFCEDIIIEANVPSSEIFVLEVAKSILSISNIMKIENQILNPQLISFQYGKANYGFGQARVKLLEVIYWFVRMRNGKIDQEIINNGLLRSLLGLFTKNPWSNIVHMALLRIFGFIIDYGSDILIDNAFGHAELLRFIIQAHDNSEFEINSKNKGKVQKAYMAYLNALANIIEESDNSTIKYYCKNSKKWQRFKDGPLEEANRKAKSGLDDEEVKRQQSLGSTGLNAAKMDDSDEIHESLQDGTISFESTGIRPSLSTKITLEGIKFEEVKFDLSSRRIWDSLQHYQPNQKKEDEALDTVSPTYAGDFKDRDINERESSEIRFPQFNDVNSGFQEEENEENNTSDILTETTLDSRLNKIGSPKLESVMVPSKGTKDENEDVIDS